MTSQQQRRQYLIDYLQTERVNELHVKPEPIPDDEAGQRRLLHRLFNLREPAPASRQFIKIQDQYLDHLIHEKPIIQKADLTAVRPKIYLWRGDLTQLAVAAIVNPANSRMLGCFIPNHHCLDNQIHTKAGIQLRLADQQAMGDETVEAVGNAKITPGFNLPAANVIHTVGPVIIHQVTPLRRELLAKSYRSCMTLATKKGLSEIAFCCISTGEFRFPHDLAAQIAIKTVTDFLRDQPQAPDVIFAVNNETDYELYQQSLERKRS